MVGPPSATYRLQLGEHLDFEGARGALDYLEALGVGALYLSPIWASAGGGGYHVTDPTRIHPALGGEEGFDRLAEDARGRGMGVILDIVPNHMKAGEESPWWADVVRWGRRSPYARFFDVDWERHGGKLLLPVLAEPGAREEDEHTIRVYWREGIPELNYRRFFDIADLVCLRQEDPDVFEATHRTVLRLVGEGKVTGLRVDHVDGLRDPQGYLERLRAAAPTSLLLVEKILAPDEDVPPGWPVDGTTGYEMGTLITGVLTDAEGAAACDRTFRAVTGGGGEGFDEILAAAKTEVLEGLFAGEVDRLVRSLRSAMPSGAPPETDVRAAIVAVTAELGVYRTYVRDASGPGSDDRARIEDAAGRATGRAPQRTIDSVAHVLLEPGERALPAVLDWQQLSGPAMAKGLEDTALYRHTALVSRNEVGGHPGERPPSPAAFHAAMAARGERGASSLTATSTHDSKRGEDVRARIAALSEMPEEWSARVPGWLRSIDRVRAPGDAAGGDPALEDLLLLQTLLGAWPLVDGPDQSFIRRVQDVMVKSAREAKLFTSWLDPDEGHEDALRRIVAALAEDPRFLASFFPFQERIAAAGAVNALAQVVLKAAVPGIPDVYQGTELWHLRLVDPDNRAPVDLHRRAQLLEELDARAGTLPILAGELLEDWRDGRVKLLVTAAALRLRKARPSLFAEGGYVPLHAEGPQAERILAFARTDGDAWAVAVVPRCSRPVAGPRWPVGDVWGDTRVRLPDDAPEAWTDAITGAVTETAAHGLLEAWRVLRHLPVALLAAPSSSPP